MADTGFTLADLLALARRQDAGVPPLLAFTIGVQVLTELAGLHRRGVAHGGVRASEIRLGGVSPERLLADPGRDPRVRLGEPPSGVLARPADDVAACGVLIAELLGDRPRPPALASFLERLQQSRAELRPSVGETLAVCRELALGLFADWHREHRPQSVGDASIQREQALRAELETALYAGRAEAVACAAGRLRERLGWAAAADVDLAVADGWLREQARLVAACAAEQQRNRLKLLLTASPIVTALLLTGLLAAVLAGT